LWVLSLALPAIFLRRIAKNKIKKAASVLETVFCNDHYSVMVDSSEGLRFEPKKERGYSKLSIGTI